ncbi:hypothetical protein [Paenibacillus sp. sgz500958]|uniref:hypothetical protein n=1 Tax=Paenibacillus sp. sgz500958 TaxID=3242475 RepID=UPI0036D400C2
MLIVPILLVIILNGCQNGFGFINSNWLSEVSLTYRQISSVEKQGEPFESKSFTDKAFLDLISDAMNQSKKLMGEYDYDADYELQLGYKDGYTEKYFLALGNENGYNGLLGTYGKRSQTYRIKAEYADKLRDYIYGRTGAAGTDKAETSVTVHGQITLSHNELFPLTGDSLDLDLRLVKGEYSEDWITPGPLAGRSWSGEFQLVVTDDRGKLLSSFPLSEHFTESLLFQDFFQIQFDDYNGDGDFDFTIGQYGTGNGSFVRLFTLGKNNVIQELKVGTGEELFISSPERYSMKLEKVDGYSFKKSYYDNASGAQVEQVYRWNGTEFENTSK